jgi:hypothetical protein
MGPIQTAARQVVHRHRWTIDGSPVFGILLGLLLALPFWIVVAWVVWALT